jgi:hypothetical protein
MELHLVHFKKSKGTLTNALKDQTGLAVLALLFEASNSTNFFFALKVINPLTQWFPNGVPRHTRVPWVEPRVPPNSGFP